MSKAWSKTIGGDFDRIDLSSGMNSDWLKIEMRIGFDVQRVSMTLRSDEAVRDLHYALGRYLANIGDK